MIHSSTGNLLLAQAEALVNPVNTQGVMGKGLALQFKHAYPTMYASYAQACRNGELDIGRLHRFELDAAAMPRWILNVPTKRHWRSRSRLEDVVAGVRALAATARELELGSLAIPPLGCGLGGLRWPQVRPYIVAAFEDWPGIEVQLFEPARDGD